MRRSPLLQRLGAFTLAERETAIDRRALRWLWSGWGISALLGFVAPLYRGTTHIHGAVPIGAAVAVMIAVVAATRRPMIGLTMSAFGLISGAALGFGLIAFVTHRALPAAATLQMALGALFLGRLFLRELRPPPTVPEDPFWEEVRLLPKEEAQIRVAERLEALHAEGVKLGLQLDRISLGTNVLIGGAAITILGGAILLILRHTAWRALAIPIAFPLVVAGLIVVLIGTYVTRSATRD